ncbi:DNA-binding protein [Dactylosporangium aurantiacum]|uniref:DNA-binding protein n=1 Tax=Dactylosporangium aurantiacum TaxID=35754 RepID=A0A9Q9ICB3_9ACTN|nr:PPC domain-containing DNA-binding protein [Dactylosporangium aurantiacum]MDG6106364.1 DNA-binding protein [Dactylosporangium aurantiacum]UWZ50593.1 DNA-binding protein [Dactylosporangium aurantiacum]
MFVVHVAAGEEVVGSINRQCADRGISQAGILLVGAVKGCTISVMPRDDETADILTDYDEPFELTGRGEIVDGRAHLHVAAGGEGRTVVGHLHRALVGGWFVRAYVTPRD